MTVKNVLDTAIWCVRIVFKRNKIVRENCRILKAKSSALIKMTIFIGLWWLKFYDIDPCPASAPAPGLHLAAIPKKVMARIPDIWKSSAFWCQ